MILARSLASLAIDLVYISEEDSATRPGDSSRESRGHLALSIRQDVMTASRGVNVEKKRALGHPALRDTQAARALYDALVRGPTSGSQPCWPRHRLRTSR